MPIYEYLCENGHRFDVLQRMSDDPVSTCEVCAAPVQRVLHPVAIHFKGSGFYTTDYGRGKAAKADGAKETSGASSSSSSSDSGSGSSSGSSSSSSGSSSNGSSAGSSTPAPKSASSD
jgi:putative FmdB family regulatory protein